MAFLNFATCLRVVAILGGWSPDTQLPPPSFTTELICFVLEVRFSSEVDRYELNEAENNVIQLPTFSSRVSADLSQSPRRVLHLPLSAPPRPR